MVTRLAVSRSLSVCPELYWTAPELLRQDLQPATGTPQGDIFSFAIILWDLMFGTKASPYCHLDLEPKGKCCTVTTRVRPAPHHLQTVLLRNHHAVTDAVLREPAAATAS